MSRSLRFRRSALAAFLLASISAMAQPVQLKVFDKVGNEVGPFDHGLVYIRLDESTIVAVRLGYLNLESRRGPWVDVTRMVPIPGPSGIYFSEPDCVGSAYLTYLSSDVPGVQPMGAVVDKGGSVTLYVGKPKFAMSRQLSSLLNGSGGCRNRRSQQTVVPVTSTFDLTAQFPVPYTLR